MFNKGTKVKLNAEGIYWNWGDSNWRGVIDSKSRDGILAKVKLPNGKIMFGVPFVILEEVKDVTESK